MTTVDKLFESAPASRAPRAGRGEAVRRFARYVFTNHLIWPLLGLVFVAGTFVDGFLQKENLLNVVWAASPLGLMTLGLFLVMVVGGLDLSLESTFSLAPTLAVVLVTEWLTGTPPVVALLLALVVGAVAGLVNGLFAVKLRVNPFLVTLATLLVMRGIVIYLIPEGVYGLSGALTFFGGEKIASIPVAAFVLLAIYGIGYLLTQHTAFGKSLYAIGNNEHAAFVAGINVDRVKMLTFVLAGVFAAVGGILEMGRLDSVVADMGEGDILMVFAAVTLGGTSLQGGEGRITGIFAAVLVIAGIDNLMNLVGVEPALRQIVFGLILLAAIYLASLQGRLGNGGRFALGSGLRR